MKRTRNTNANWSSSNNDWLTSVAKTKNRKSKIKHFSWSMAKIKLKNCSFYKRNLKIFNSTFVGMSFWPPNTPSEIKKLINRKKSYTKSTSILFKTLLLHCKKNLRITPKLTTQTLSQMSLNPPINKYLNNPDSRSLVNWNQRKSNSVCSVSMPIPKTASKMKS